MKKIIIITFTILGFGLHGFAQQNYYVEALKFTQVYPIGTARSASMGGAFGALGGDMLSLATNPAGLGVFRKSEFTITPTFNYTNTGSKYYSESSEDFVNKINFTNIGFVSSYNTNKSEGWVSANFGISYNRLKDFNENRLIEGHNLNSSMVDKFLDDAWGNDPEILDPFSTRLAFDAYLIDTVPGSDYNYTTPVPYEVFQRNAIETSGGMGEWNFSFGTNFSYKLYLGASLGISTIRYKEINDYSESDSDPNNDFDNFLFHNQLKTWGTGYNFKFGFIFRPVDFIRIGGAIHLPTAYKISEEYDSHMDSYFSDGSHYSVSPTNPDGSVIEFGSFDYKLVTPFKSMGDIAILFGKSGLISVDAEYINYDKMRLREPSDGGDFYYDNNIIQDDFRGVLNIRAGGEIRFDQIALRGGYAYFPSPYKKGTLNEKANRSDITAGIGIRDKNFFVDLAGVYSIQKENYNLYTAYSEVLDNVTDNIAELTRNRIRILATIGFRF